MTDCVTAQPCLSNNVTVISELLVIIIIIIIITALKQGMRPFSKT